MNVDTICEAIASLDNVEWFLEPGHNPDLMEIRGNVKSESGRNYVTCPLLWYRENFITDTVVAAELFKSELGESIMDAADDNCYADHPEIRNKLLVATGFEGESTTPAKESSIWTYVAIATFTVISILAFARTF